MPAPSDSPLADRLKQVLRHLPAPVGIVTSFDPTDAGPIGLAMSAIMPVSLDPCAMAIAVNRAGSSHAGMLAAGQFCINLLDSERHAHIAPFASAGLRDQRFADAAWRQRGQVWYLDGAPANIFCEIRATLSYGTHDLVVGEVSALIATGGAEILGWANGAPGRLAPLGSA